MLERSKITAFKMLQLILEQMRNIYTEHVEMSKRT